MARCPAPSDQNKFPRRTEVYDPNDSCAVQMTRQRNWLFILDYRVLKKRAKCKMLTPVKESALLLEVTFRSTCKTINKSEDR